MGVRLGGRIFQTKDTPKSRPRALYNCFNCGDGVICNKSPGLKALEGCLLCK